MRRGSFHTHSRLELTDLVDGEKLRWWMRSIPSATTASHETRNHPLLTLACKLAALTPKLWLITRFAGSGPDGLYEHHIPVPIIDSAIQHHPSLCPHCRPEHSDSLYRATPILTESADQWICNSHTHRCSPCLFFQPPHRRRALWLATVSCLLRRQFVWARFASVPWTLATPGRKIWVPAIKPPPTRSWIFSMIKGATSSTPPVTINLKSRRSGLENGWKDAASVIRWVGESSCIVRPFGAISFLQTLGKFHEMRPVYDGANPWSSSEDCNNSDTSNSLSSGHNRKALESH